jgi:NAD(P)-dependent dehydrogenase (short-subunit alcohol dehydrogenase family)
MPPSAGDSAYSQYIPAEDWDAVLAVNLRGLWLMAQAVLKRMVARGGGGSVINISSVLATRVPNGSDHASRRRRSSS